MGIHGASSAEDLARQRPHGTHGGACAAVAVNGPGAPSPRLGSRPSTEPLRALLSTCGEEALLRLHRMTTGATLEGGTTMDVGLVDACSHRVMLRRMRGYRVLRAGRAGDHQHEHAKEAQRRQSCGLRRQCAVRRPLMVHKLSRLPRRANPSRKPCVTSLNMWPPSKGTMNQVGESKQEVDPNEPEKGG